MIIYDFLKDNHWPEAVKIHAECFPDPWSLEAMQSVYRQVGMFAIGAFENDFNRLTGFCIFQQLFDTTEIITICVKPAWQRKGIGIELMNHIIALSFKQSIDRVILEVRESNGTALSLYTKLGFKKNRTRENYYNTSENAIVMIKVLQNK